MPYIGLLLWNKVQQPNITQLLCNPPADCVYLQHSNGRTKGRLTYWYLGGARVMCNLWTQFSDWVHEQFSWITLGWLLQNTFDDKSTLVQVVACCDQATRHYLNHCWPRSMPPYGVTKPKRDYEIRRERHNQVSTSANIYWQCGVSDPSKSFFPCWTVSVSCHNVSKLIYIMITYWE